MWLAVCLSLVAGCQLPDVNSFANSVAAVHEGVDRSGSVYSRAAATVLGEDAALVAQFEKDWAKRRRATAALVRYADSLAATVDAATNVQQNVDALGQAVEDLGSSIGISGLAGSEVFQVGGRLYELGVKVAAHRSLAKAVGDAHAGIDHIAKQILVVDLQAMRASLDAVEQAALTSLETDAIEDDKKNLVALIERRSRLEKALAASWNDGQAEELAKLLAVIEPIEERVAENARQIALVEEQTLAQKRLVERTIEAINEIVLAHLDLRTALAEKQDLNTRSLIAAAGEISRTIEDIEKIREQQND